MPVVLMSAGDRICARSTMPIPDHAVYLAKSFTIDELRVLVVRLTGARCCPVRDRGHVIRGGAECDHGSECRP
jgi:hypothetical protein